MKNRPGLEHMRRYLREHFTDVTDEESKDEYHLFSMKLLSGEFRRVKVYREVFRYPGTLLTHLRKGNLIERLKEGDVSFKSILE
jgi:hypothetical protein